MLDGNESDTELNSINTLNLPDSLEAFAANAYSLSCCIFAVRKPFWKSRAKVAELMYANINSLLYIKFPLVFLACSQVIVSGNTLSE